MEALAYALEFPGSDPHLFRETYDDLEANLIREFKDRVPQALYDYNGSKYVARLKNGSEIKFRHVAGPEDARRYDGRSIPWIGVDELGKHSKETIQFLRSCNRSAKGWPALFRATGNPGGQGHMAVVERYIRPTDYGKKTYIDPITGQTVQFIPANVYDGVLTDKDPMYVKRLENLPEKEKQAFLYGNYDIFEGLFFDFDPSVHVIDDIEIPSWWPRYIGLDWGFYPGYLAVVWVAVDGAGKHYQYRELYVQKHNPEQAADAIMERNGTDAYMAVYSSPDMFKASQYPGKDDYSPYSIANIMEQRGLYGLVKANNDRASGWARFKQLLYFDKNHEPQYVITKNCTETIRVMQECIYSTKGNPEDMDAYCEDHLPEAARYLCMGTSEGTPPVAEQTAVEKMIEEITMGNSLEGAEHYGI